MCESSRDIGACVCVISPFPAVIEFCGPVDKRLVVSYLARSAYSHITVLVVQKDHLNRRFILTLDSLYKCIIAKLVN